MRRTLIALTLLTAAPLHAGELTPPAGPIAPTGRFGPRIEITSLPFTITTSGSYYLGRDLTGVSGQNGVRISADDVTLDLNGFALVGVTGSARGISLDQNVGHATIRDGTVTGWGAYGIYSTDPGGNVFEDLHLNENGFAGIVTGSHSVITRCVAYGNGHDGIATGVATVVTDCTAAQNGQSGFNAYSSVLRGCTSRSNDFDGFSVQTGSIVTDCVAHQNTRDGIRAHQGCTIVRNDCSLNGNGGDGAGVHVQTGAGSRVEANNVSLNDRGVDVDQPGNLVIRNSASSNGLNYSVVGGNGVGPTITAAAVGTNTNPHANFSL